MFLIDVACPRDSLSEDDRRAVADAVCEVLVGAEEGVSAATMRRARAMTHVGFRELESWTTGHGSWSPGEVPPLWVTFTVPEAWRAEMSRTAIGAVRRGVRSLDRAHGWHREEGALWVNIVGIVDGSIGMDGKQSTADDVVAQMTAEFRAQHEAESADLADGVVIDPMCGMHVRLVPGAITLEHDGRTLGFCAASCRAAYAREHGLPVPA